MRSYSAVVAEELFSFFVYLVSRLFYKGILMCCSNFSFFRFFFFPVRFRALLRAHVGFREDIQAPAFIIDCIKEGYNIPFYVTPAGASFKNNHSALQHAEFVYEAILELVSTNGVVEVAKSHLKIINPLSVSVQSCGKKRLILD